jgi:hypothetical protein
MAGYNPASNVQAQLPQSTVKYYDKAFLENLKAQTPFVRCAERRDLPPNAGNQLVLFEYNVFGANINQTAEGNVPSGIQTGLVSNTSTIGEYADYASFSSLSLVTAIDPVVENVAKEMAYRLGQSLSALVRLTADGASAVDAAANVQLAATSLTAFTPIDINVVRAQIQSLAGRSVRPFNEPEARFAGVIHPFAWGDAINATANNSPIDVLKHTSEGRMQMEELPSADLTEVFRLPATGVDFFQTNLVTQTTTYKGVTNLTALRTYIFGRDGVIAINLAGRGDTPYGDGDYRGIRCNVVQNAPISVADPEGLIPGWTSYRVHFTVTLPPDSTARLRTIDAASGVS